VFNIISTTQVMVLPTVFFHQGDQVTNYQQTLLAHPI